VSLQPRLPVSVVILTLNEEANVRECLASCAAFDDVHVLDSGSTDETVRIARQAGATVHAHAFESFGAQRNWAIDHIPSRYDWLFHLDADERFTPELTRELAQVLASNPPEAGFFVPEKLMFMDRWLRRAGAYPRYQVRLFHKHRMRFRDHGHGQREATDGAIGFLRQPYLHYSFAKGLDDWFARHRGYSRREAKLAMDSRAALSFSGLVSDDAVERRRALKDISHRLPFRPFLRWFHTLFVLGGIVEGRAGRTYARLLASYERMIVSDVRALRSGRR
jgi:glycosyltransferase involved in cell wall biosynthesis